ncbi:glycosyltransferase [Jannaschia sp. 2305UL9-9]|uniref:glycosyltransferase n=1 Tax=Jannaschia sp. 2305UL9-9 TaxID=3121638 RepID=UPI00352960C7
MTGIAPPRLAVLLATCNGAAWLRPQLDSLVAQSLRPDLIVVSDDGSTDGTETILDEFLIQHPDLPVTRIAGPRQGAAANFLSLIKRAPEGVDRLSFADQDDVWLPGKLERAMARLDAFDAEDAATPALYCSRIMVCDRDLVRRRPSRLPPRAPSFRNALTQNIATGNTIVLNAAATRLVRAAAGRTGDLIVHDWWLYQIVTGGGGRILLDVEPQTLYRQHGANLIGANSGIVARGRRLAQLWSGVYGRWNTVNLAALMAVRDLLTPENAALVEAFAAARDAGPWGRVAAIRRLGLYRQGHAGQASLYAAAALGKF